MTTEPIFLMPEEVEVLTGFKTSARQVAWLRIKGFLAELGLVERRGQRVILARNLLGTLRDRELGGAGKVIQDQTGLT